MARGPRNIVWNEWASEEALLKFVLGISISCSWRAKERIKISWLFELI